MLFEEWLENIASYLGADSTSAGILISCMMTIAIVLIVAVASKGHNLGILLSGFMCMSIFTVMGWLPYWIMLMFALIVAGLYAQKIRDMFGGGGGSE